MRTRCERVRRPLRASETRKIFFLRDASRATFLMRFAQNCANADVCKRRRRHATIALENVDEMLEASKIETSKSRSRACAKSASSASCVVQIGRCATRQDNRRGRIRASSEHHRSNCHRADVAAGEMQDGSKKKSARRKPGRSVIVAEASFQCSSFSINSEYASGSSSSSWSSARLLGLTTKIQPSP